MIAKRLNKSSSENLPSYLYASLAVLWLYSGIVPVAMAQQQSLAMLAQLGIPDGYQMSVFILASLIDIIFGVLIFTRYRYHYLLWLVQLMVVVSYSIIVAIGLPDNWTHPFAPLIKNVPIIALLCYLFQTHLAKPISVK